MQSGFNLECILSKVSSFPSFSPSGYGRLMLDASLNLTLKRISNLVVVFCMKVSTVACISLNFGFGLLFLNLLA